MVIDGPQACWILITSSSQCVIDHCTLNIHLKFPASTPLGIHLSPGPARSCQSTSIPLESEDAERTVLLVCTGHRMMVAEAFPSSPIHRQEPSIRSILFAYGLWKHSSVTSIIINYLWKLLTNFWKTSLNQSTSTFSDQTVTSRPVFYLKILVADIVGWLTPTFSSFS